MEGKQALMRTEERQTDVGDCQFPPEQAVVPKSELGDLVSIGNLDARLSMDPVGSGAVSRRRCRPAQGIGDDREEVLNNDSNYAQRAHERQAHD